MRFRAMLCALGLLMAAAPAGALDLKGEVTQGGFLMGKVDPSAQVWLNGKPLDIADTGYFVFGIGREDKGAIKLRVMQSGAARVIELPIKERQFKIDRVDGVPERTVTIPAAEKKRRAKETAMVAEARANSTADSFWAQGFIKPVEKARISGVYGSQRILNGKPRWPHYGLDMAAPIGTPVHAPADGVVRLAAPDFLLEGGIIIIDHGQGVNSTLMHLNTVDVKVGQHVKQGEVVATLGMKGRANGPHVDWRINVGDVRVDPQLALNAPNETVGTAQ